MNDVSSGEGRTVLFVSHNMSSIKQLCNKGIFLEKGEIKYKGEIENCIELYSNENISNKKEIIDFVKTKNQILHIESIEINHSKNSSISLNHDENTLNITIEGFTDESLNFEVEALFYNSFDTPFAFYCPAHFNGITPKFEKGKFSIKRTITLPENTNKGNLFMSLFLCDAGKEVYMELSNKIKISLEGTKMETGWVFNIDGAGLLYLK